ncbi:MAG: gliding motility-associated C-terminal domain-containing protein [Chitinophagaceae bacterium]
MGIVSKISIITFFFLSNLINVNAQLCQGSLGDAIVNITFGTGLNPGPSLAAASTSYQYVANDCPNDGYYTVRNVTANCFSSSWQTLISDHTGDVNGYFMLVNASVQPSAFYIDTVKGLCSNTTFEFAAWVTNVLRTTACNSNGIQPNLTFTIEKTDGSLLQTYNTGNISSQSNPTWQQYGFFFNTPVGVSDVVLRIFNNSQGGCGNDLALDDITFRPCGPQLTPVIVGYPTTTVSYCEGSPQLFTFNVSVSAGFNNPSYQWQQSLDGINWADIIGETSTVFIKNFISSTTTGNYKFRLSAAETGNLNAIKCRVVSSVLTIQLLANPVTTATSNTPVCEGNTMLLNATGGTQFQWTNSNSFSATGAMVSVNNVQLSQAGKYYVQVTNAAGCTHLDSVITSINIKPVASTTFSTAFFCEGDNVQLISSGGISYQWLPATGLSSAIIANPVASPVDTTQYMVIVSNSSGCSDTAKISISVIERPRVNAGPDKIIIAGNPIQLSATASGQNISYYWSPATFINNAQALQPIVSPPVEMDYTLTAVSNEGCKSATDMVRVYVYKEIFVPTGFTPDGDGLNDTWNIPALGAFGNFDLSVFNRYGQLIFLNKDINRAWDGKYNGLPQPSGVYIYIIKMKESGVLLKGTVQIIR